MSRRTTVINLLESRAARMVVRVLFVFARPCSILHEGVRRARKFLHSSFLRIRCERRGNGSAWGEKSWIEPTATVYLEPEAVLNVGRNVNIDTHCVIKIFGTGSLIIEDDTYIGPYTHIYVTHEVRLGRGVIVGPFGFLIDHDHALGDDGFPSLHERTRNESDRIVVSEGAWLGTRTSILKGVSVGRASILGAGAVVTEDIPQRCVAAGVPARIIRDDTRAGKPVDHA